MSESPGADRFVFTSDLIGNDREDHKKEKTQILPTEFSTTYYDSGLPGGEGLKDQRPNIPKVG